MAFYIFWVPKWEPKSNWTDSSAGGKIHLPALGVHGEHVGHAEQENSTATSLPALAHRCCVLALALKGRGLASFGEGRAGITFQSQSHEGRETQGEAVTSPCSDGNIDPTILMSNSNAQSTGPARSRLGMRLIRESWAVEHVTLPACAHHHHKASGPKSKREKRHSNFELV